MERKTNQKNFRAVQFPVTTNCIYFATCNWAKQAYKDIFYYSLIIIMIINNNFYLRSLMMLTTWNFTVFLVSALHCRASKSLSSYVVIIKWLLLPKSSWSCLATLVLDGMCIHENLAFVSVGTLTAQVTCILWPSQDSTDIDELNLSIKRSEKNKAHNHCKANICLYI